MLHPISWHSYWTALILSYAGYYVIVYLVYFRRAAVPIPPSGKKTNAVANKSGMQLPLIAENKDPDFAEPPANSEEHAVYACMDELNAFFDNQKKSKAVKSEVMYALYSILKKYPSLFHSQYKESLTNVVATQCEAICSIHLSAEELKGVWLG